MIATIWLAYSINDSIMLLCGFLSSQLFFTDFNLFLKVLQGLKNYKNPLVSLSWSSFIDLIDLVPHSSFLKFLLRSDLLPSFFSLLIKCNTSCQCASNLSSHFTPDSLSKLRMPRENDIQGGANPQASDISHYHLLFRHFFTGHICFSRINIQFHFQVFKK